MGMIDKFLNEKEIEMHNELGVWCDCSPADCETCVFNTAEYETDPAKMHWCYCDVVEMDKLHPAFLDALYRDYGYYMTHLKETKEDTTPANTPVNHPEHYNQGSIECIDAMISAFGKEATAHFCIINAFKYIWRADSKQKLIEDIDKAIWYLNKFKELSE